jgi:Protein of unknown function (DUF616)
MINLYTVITNNKDNAPEQDYPIQVFRDSYDKFRDSRRNSRIQKIMPHKFMKCDYSIYMDGNMKLLISPEELIKRYMTGYDIAFFKHGSRDCIYDEAMAVSKLGLDDPELIIEQAKYYEDNEFPKHKGLLQGGFIIRRHNSRVEAFNEAWWADYCRFSRRDQLSLMPAIDKSGVVVNMIDEKWVEKGPVATIGDVVEMRQHANFSGNFNDPQLK